MDRLSSDQPPLLFAIYGITLVHGANASGKSGYCRIARQLCRSLSLIDLRGNVYDAGAPTPPEVAVAFRVGGDDQTKEELTWCADQGPFAELSRISVFDTASACVYGDRQRKIEFPPHELDLLNKLGLVIRSPVEGFRERLADVSAAVSTRLPEAYHEGSNVQATLASLVTQTTLEDLPTAPELQAFGSWSVEKQAALETAGEHLRQDPQDNLRFGSGLRPVTLLTSFVLPAIYVSAEVRQEFALPSSFGVIDLFAGSGGLGEGFAYLREAGQVPYQIGISVENKASAHRTLKLRAFLREVRRRKGKLPGEFIEFHAGRTAVPDWAEVDGASWRAATDEALYLELGNRGAKSELDDAIKKVRRKFDDTVLIGGPPCQACSLARSSR